MQSHIVCICLTFLQRLFFKLSSNCVPKKRQNHIGCICLTFLHYVFPNVSSNFLRLRAEILGDIQRENSDRHLMSQEETFFLFFDDTVYSSSAHCCAVFLVHLVAWWPDVTEETFSLFFDITLSTLHLLLYRSNPLELNTNQTNCDSKFYNVLNWNWSGKVKLWYFFFSFFFLSPL